MHSIADLSTREFHPHQYVKVSVSATKTEIGIVVTADEDRAVVATRHGYNITVKPKQLQRAFLLVLDLNGVLGARQRKTLFERRPHLEQFLKFALTNFVVAVWTSCEERNGKQIVEDLLADDRDRLLFCLYRGDCSPKPTADRPFGTTKNLQQIFDRWPESFHAVNTIIVDDSPDKCSHPDIALCPPQFAGLAEQPEDDGLLSTIAVLQQVLDEDSLHPLIEAAKQHQLRMEEAGGTVRLHDPSTMAVPSSSTTVMSCDHAAMCLSAGAMKALQDKRTLCCHYFTDGVCKFGGSCRFVHVDDGVACCSKGEKCRVHGARVAAAAVVDAANVHCLKLAKRDTEAGPPRQQPFSATNIAQLLLAKLNNTSSPDKPLATGPMSIGADAPPLPFGSFSVTSGSDDSVHFVEQAGVAPQQRGYPPSSSGSGSGSPHKFPPQGRVPMPTHHHHQRGGHARKHQHRGNATSQPSNGNSGGHGHQGGQRSVVSILQHAPRVNSSF